MSQIKYFILSLRPYQFTKNLVVYAALIFAGHLFIAEDLLQTTMLFICFSLVSGGLYIINDIVDRKEDSAHPDKKRRPIASGRLNRGFALFGSVVLAASAITSTFVLDLIAGYIVSGYALMILIYSLILKKVVILDILVVAIGFVLRAVAGAVVISVVISPWLLVCTFFLALFLVIGKRRYELNLLKGDTGSHRFSLNYYSLPFIDQMIAVVTAACLISYALYTLDSGTVEKFGTTNLIYTIPFVVVGIFRYFYLIYKEGTGGSPEKIFIKDGYILLTVFLWALTSVVIVY
jgi:4-hydroxybenzoate polyprenyltransferase